MYKHPFKINCQQLKNMLECQLRMLKIVIQCASWGIRWRIIQNKGIYVYTFLLYNTPALAHIWEFERKRRKGSDLLLMSMDTKLNCVSSSSSLLLCFLFGKESLPLMRVHTINCSQYTNACIACLACSRACEGAHAQDLAIIKKMKTNEQWQRHNPTGWVNA